MNEKREKVIRKGLVTLLEKKLEFLDNAMMKKNYIAKEVDEYWNVIKVAEREGVDVTKYHKRYRSKIRIWNNKYVNGGLI